MTSGEIATAFARAESGGEVVSRALVRTAMEREDVYVQATVYDYIMEPRYTRYIVPSLELADYLAFIPRFVRSCMQLQVSDQPMLGQELVGYEFMQWLVSLYEDRNIPRRTLVELKCWLADFYRESDHELRLLIVVVEHLFENKKIRRFFSDWKADPVLSRAYDEAQSWIQGLSRSNGRPAKN
jgi:hypothetical protein